ncbi:hypothetical protein RJ639_046919 [Escallonia herrerae]|uniref:Uncharacterized protein n=1 Tax=Escallonia herrerae TaxID=1293975 RepID=A0AA88W774_9ASTE|nr:hypothetical protein RJ639_046919 [Escallonia herrerae]
MRLKERIKAATMSAAEGLSRAQAERVGAAAARNVNAYGQEEGGPSRWEQRKAAKALSVSSFSATVVNHEQNLYHINLGINNNKQTENEQSPIEQRTKDSKYRPDLKSLALDTS